MSGNESTNLKNAANMDTTTSFFLSKTQKQWQARLYFPISSVFSYRFINRLSNDFIAKKNYSEQKKTIIKRVKCIF